MKKQTFLLCVSILSGIVFLLSLSGCAKKKVDDGKIPITTSSDEARKEYLQGRDLADKLLIQNSIQHFENAVAKDPSFASGYFLLAQSSPTAKGFFDNMKKAVALADKASEGERLLIAGFQAGVDADQPRQKEIYEKLVSVYPKDERAHFALGNYYNGLQNYPKAVEHYVMCTMIDSNYSPAYNSLGYAYRAMEKYDDAEKAFKKYTDLIPNDPNPPDSYAELLMKMGKFDESITAYRKALSIDPNFVSSHVGVAANLMYMGKPDEATAELQKLYDISRDDGERRIALFNMVVLNIDGGKMDQALLEADKEHSVAEKGNDVANMSADLVMKGNILQEIGKYDDAMALYDKSLKMIEESDLTQGVKDNAKLAQHFVAASIAIGKKDMKMAKVETEEFRKGADAIKNTFQMRQAHELAGMIALAEKKYDDAIAELQQANQLNPYNLYRLSLAYQGKKDKAMAKDFCMKAAKNNTLPTLNYAFIRSKAEKMLATM
jgi:tetratricopeptide (TPR) repeat protein